MRGTNSIVIIIAGIMLASCKADMICPSYQSYFLLDETAQKNQFAYFALDSLPRRDIFNSNKDQKGLVAKSGLLAYVDADWQRNLDIKTISMEVIYPEPSDSTLFAGDAMMYAETDIIDSVALDSARYAAQSFRYGADQKYYNWYFRDKLVWKDELNKTEEPAKASTPKPVEPVPEIATEEKKGLGGMFKKKDKEPKQPKEKKVKSQKQKKVKEPVLEKEPTPPIKKEEDDGEDDF